MRSPADLKPELPHWDKTADLVDQCIDLALNLSQSGHPGGSRSKVHALLTLMLSGAMRWDIRHPEERFADRFVLVAGHCNPVVYAALAVLNEAMRLRHEATGDARFAHPLGREFTLLPEDLLTLRQNGGLPGHAEMEGKTLFFKANPGPSGHGSPIAAGQASCMPEDAQRASLAPRTHPINVANGRRASLLPAARVFVCVQPCCPHECL